MRNYILLLFIGLAISLTSCRQDFEFEPSTGELEFSKDTVYCDTVFSDIGSSTYTLKVYNRSNKDIKIPRIQLEKGLNSKYRITVDGMTGENNNNRIFDNVEMLAKDSMYIFIEVTADVVDANPTDFLYTDKILFDVGENQQKVDLVTLIQDAYFLYPRRFDDGTTETLNIGGIEEPVYGFVLDENDPVNGNEFVWGNDKPYVVYGYAAVPNGRTLTVEAGARVHFHDASGLIIGNGASLHVEGEYSTTPALENEVIFEGDRLEPEFSDVSGQWQTVWLTSGSTNNSIKHLTIKNAAVGLNIDNNDGTSLVLENTQIYNSSLIGIYAKTAKIRAKNVVVNYGGVASMACIYGGDYEFTHCTFNNNWPSSRQSTVILNDYIRTDDGDLIQSLQSSFVNCIIYGSNANQLSLEQKGTSFSSTFQNCLVRLSSTNPAVVTNPLYDTVRLQQNGNLVNQNPRFKDISKNQLIILNQTPNPSAAINKGINLSPNFNDILNNTRPASPNTNPDIGAYNAINE